MECKTALINSDGNPEKAILALRNKSIPKLVNHRPIPDKPQYILEKIQFSFTNDGIKILLFNGTENIEIELDNLKACQNIFFKE